jgi:HEXXH motif-containing protein
LNAVGWLSDSADRAQQVIACAPDASNIFAHPSFRYVLSALRRTARDDPERLVSFLTFGLGDFAWPCELMALARSSGWRSRLDDEGGLRVGATGTFLEFGSAYRGAEVEVTPDRGRAQIVVLSDGLTVEVLAGDIDGSACEDAPTIELNGFECSLAPRTAGGTEIGARDSWLRPRLTGTNQRTDGTTFFESTWDIYQRKPDQGRLEANLELLRQIWPTAAAELPTFVRTIIPLRSTPSRAEAFTVGSRQGAVYLGDASPLAMLEMLVHETAHVKLRQIQLLDPMLTDPLDDRCTLEVPWRTDLRPVPGVLEGLFVFTHVAELEARLLEQGRMDNPCAIERRLKHLDVARSLVASADLTPAGREILEVLGQWVSTLSHRVA